MVRRSLVQHFHLERLQHVRQQGKDRRLVVGFQEHPRVAQPEDVAAELLGGIPVPSQALDRHDVRANVLTLRDLDDQDFYEDR